MAKAPDMMAMHKMYMKAKGTTMVIIGILVVLNQMYSVLDWATFVGVVLILAGLAKLFPCKKK
ncbi:hypothetical protein KY332_01130 [Candidatus Woesearchaeota archaeon]|nr:hypothetical protein [Candidatus Woesearchaeota archaeon]